MSGDTPSTRLAIVSSHPTQYYAPWFRRLAENAGLEVRVFYLWDFGVRSRLDRGFGHEIRWDLPLLEGYASEFVPNWSTSPGTHHFLGLLNPGLGRAVDRFRPDAVMVYGYRPASLTLFAASRRRRYPLLFRGDSHRLAGTGAGSRAASLLLPRVFGWFDAFLPVGTANREYFETYGVPARKLFFCPHAIDTERFGAEAAHTEPGAWRRRHGLPEDQTVVLFVGKLVDRKRPQDLQEAVQKLGRKEVTLVFAGSGELEPELRSRNGGESLFLGWQNQTELPACYAAADLLVLPSAGPSETWGLVVNEAMACGTACAVSEHVGCARDLIRQGKTGWTFPARNPSALASVLEKATRDRANLAAIGLEARRHLLSGSTYAHATAGLLDAVAAVRKRRSP